MSCNKFRFKRFVIEQSGAAMKVGTDGVLLGAWCDISRRPETVLDIGTGTGLLALIIAQRCEGWGCRADAVEIDTESYRQACANIAGSPWAGNVTAWHSSIQNFVRLTKRKYDLVISNPPYFENSLQSPDGSRTAARHTTGGLSRRELMECAGACLAPEGLFAMIIPHDQTIGTRRLAEEYGLYLHKHTEVSPAAGLPPHRSMLLFGREKPECEPIPGRLAIEDGGRHVYSAEYKELTRDFYLKF